MNSCVMIAIWSVVDARDAIICHSEESIEHIKPEPL